jgi:radical SAM protein with 4Fe4S-binding SPASM domain
LQVPLSLVILPTYRCYTDCVYCYAERPALPSSEYLPHDRWIELLTEAGEFGLDLLTFSGGDPLMYPGIEELLEVAHRFQMSCVLPTKTLVTRRRADRLAVLTSTSDVIQVSVDSFDPEISAVLTRTAGYAAIARKSIQNLRAAGVRVRTNTVVTPINLASVEPLLRELRAMGVTRANVTNYSRTHYRHDERLLLTDAQYDELNQTVQRLKTELDWPEMKCNASSRDFSKPGGNSSPEKWRERSHCSGGTSSMVILPNGDVVLCDQVPAAAPFVVGNVRHDNLLEVWNSDRLFEFVVPPREKFGTTPCRECEEFDTCHRVYGRCFRDALFNYGTMFAPNPNCPHAPRGIRMA